MKRFCLFLPNGGLIIGAPASPALFNLYAGVLLDEPLGALCAKWGVTYTRYLDDFTFSAPEGNPIGEKKRRAIREVIARAGFEVSHRKSAVYDLRKGAIIINGVGLEHGGRIFCPRHYTEKIKGVMLLRLGRRNVSREVVSGMMGVFHDLTRGRRMNRTEQKLAALARKAGVLRDHARILPPRKPKREWWSVL